MQIILSALKAEAMPLINYYKLVPNNSIGLQMYNNDSFTILITGVGKKNVNKTLKAYLKKSKNIEGSIEKNKFADFIVIDRDIMKIDIDKTPQAKVLKTFLGGQLVYSSTKTN